MSEHLVTTLLNLGQWSLGGLAVILLYGLRGAFKGGYFLKSGESLKRSHEDFVGKRFEPFEASVNKRFDDAGKKSSDLASKVQVLPDQMRDEFDERYMPRELSEERWKRHAELEERIHDLEINCARTHGRGHR